MRAGVQSAHIVYETKTLVGAMKILHERVRPSLVRRFNYALIEFRLEIIEM